jgi:hypothetical protein
MLYPGSHRLLVALSGLVLAAPATGKPAAHPMARNLPWCEVEYQRADNMWAPDANLGTETVTVSPGWKRWFITDWKYEKFRNDGVRFYGSHLRVAKNTGTMDVGLSLRNQFGSKWVGMQPGQTQQFRDDLEYVYCDGTVNRAP